MLAAEANNYFFQRPKRAVAIRSDGDDFVVSLRHVRPGVFDTCSNIASIHYLVRTRSLDLPLKLNVPQTKKQSTKPGSSSTVSTLRSGRVRDYRARTHKSGSVSARRRSNSVAFRVKRNSASRENDAMRQKPTLSCTRAFDAPVNLP